MEGVRINAVIDEERKRRLFHVLLDEKLSFTVWLRRQIDAYLKEKEATGRTRHKPGKGA